MSALDLVVLHGRRTQEHYRLARIELEQIRSERDTLTARAAELEAQAAQLIVMDGNDGDGLAAINRLYAACERGDIDQHAAPDIQAARAELITFRDAQPVTLTPRNCQACRHGAELMREQAANAALMSDDTRANLSDAIRALPLPDCSVTGVHDCNPLAPVDDDVCRECGVSGGKHHFDCDLI